MSLVSHFARACSSAARTPLALLAAFAALVAIAAAMPFGSAVASADADTTAAKYYGYWNYDQPNSSTLNNVDVLACPDGTGKCDPLLPLPLEVPQVGWVLFAPGPNGTINGTSDQGCTWNFTITPTGLELSSTTQQCFNKDVGSVGNLTKWSVQVNGNKETEQITAISHQPNGVDIIGTMNVGSRTKVVPGQDNGTFVHRFVGDFNRNPAEMLVNVVLTDTGKAYPEQGTVVFSAKESQHGKINAHTPDGCDWTLAVHGDTAELDPATQTCHTPNGDINLRYWALVTDDGRHVNDYMAGTITAPDQPTANMYLYSGALTRSATTRPDK